MELGGNIELHGYVEEQEADLVIIKKIVGRFTKRITEHHDDVEGLAVVFSAQEGSQRVEGRLQLGETTLSASSVAKNKYLALDKTLKELEDHIQA